MYINTVIGICLVLYDKGYSIINYASIYLITKVSIPFRNYLIKNSIFYLSTPGLHIINMEKCTFLLVLIFKRSSYLMINLTTNTADLSISIYVLLYPYPY